MNDIYEHKVHEGSFPKNIKLTCSKIFLTAYLGPPIFKLKEC